MTLADSSELGLDKCSGRARHSMFSKSEKIKVVRGAKQDVVTLVCREHCLDHCHVYPL